jgi:hypothetical protein
VRLYKLDYREGHGDPDGFAAVDDDDALNQTKGVLGIVGEDPLTIEQFEQHSGKKLSQVVETGDGLRQVFPPLT